jgi:Fic family protein
MDPTTPDLTRLTPLASELMEAARLLGGRLHPDTLAAVSALLRTVNCYYSNLIEGHDTHPVEIDRAMAADYSADPKRRSLQLEARAHIEVQLLLEKDLVAHPDRNVCAPDYLRWIHREFYERLPGEFGVVRDSTGTRDLLVSPGELRTYDVQVGRHIAPDHQELSALLARYATAYDPARHSDLDALMALGAAHHRLLWIHPFGDGNGRVARLMTDAYLRRVGVGGHGLWTASRGLARRSTDYRDGLAAADAVRRNDYDGRGPLSLKALSDFCEFFLEVCLDQVRYMDTLLDVNHLVDRVNTYGRARVAGVIVGPAPDFRSEATLLLEHLVLRGSIPRSDVPDLLRLHERTARRVVRLLTDEGFIQSPTTRAPISLRFPAHAALYLFPDLYQPRGT